MSADHPGPIRRIPLRAIKEALDRLPDQRTPTCLDWERLSVAWRDDLDRRVTALQHLRDRLSGCIGCGCLSLGLCKLVNPADVLGAWPGVLGGTWPCPARAVQDPGGAYPPRRRTHSGRGADWLHPRTRDPGHHERACRVAGKSGTTYYLATPLAAAPLLLETVTACVAKGSGALLSYTAGVPSGSAASAVQVPAAQRAERFGAPGLRQHFGSEGFRSHQFFRFSCRRHRAAHQGDAPGAGQAGVSSR